MENWKAWVVALGDAAVNPGTPLGKSKIMSSAGVSDGDEANSLSGFSVVKADSMEAALQMAKECPFMKPGTMEVAEMRSMRRRRSAFCLPAT